jgi:large subunit ribosomal protein L21e
MTKRMHKRIREKGKTPLSKIFIKLNEGDKVVLMHNPSFTRVFPPRFQGRTGVVAGMRGRAYEVGLRDGGKNKTFIINQIHLKKIK